LSISSVNTVAIPASI